MTSVNGFLSSLPDTRAYIFGSPGRQFGRGFFIMNGAIVLGHQLANGQLEVDIAEIGRYQGTRFDRTGFITQVKLTESGHTFCVHEFAEGLPSGRVWNVQRVWTA